MSRSSITASQLAAPKFSPGGVSLKVVDAGLPQNRLSGRSLALAQLAWVALAVINLVAYLSGIPASYTLANSLLPATVSRLAELGLQPNFLGTYLILLDTLTLAVFGFVALSLFKLRRRRL